MALTVIKPSGIDTSGNYTVNGMNVSANLSAANLSATTSANLGAVGNITITGGSGGQVLSTNGSGGLSFITIGTAGVSNGNSNIAIATAGGNVTTSVDGNANILVVTGTGTNITGTLSVSGNANVGNIGTTNLVATGTGSFGANVNMNTYWINNVGYPSLTTDVATKSYVDTMISTGIAYHQPVAVATTTTLAVATGGTTAYNSPNGASNGIGAYISTTGTYLNIDSANVQTVGTRILVKDEANATWNGVYTYANTTAIVRSTDTDEYGPDSTTQLSVNDYFFTQGGTVNKGVSFIVSAPAGTITFGTSNITFSEFSTSQVYSAGTGIAITGTVISANASQTQVTAVGTLTTLSVSGNATVGNLIASSGSGGNITGANLVSANYFTGTLTTAAQPNITSTGTLSSLSVSGNSNIGNIGTAGLITATGNLNAGNIITGGIVSATGNITAGFFIGNGSQLTGLNTAGVSNGNSNVNIATANGNVTIASAGNTTMTITGTGANINGTFAVSTYTRNASVGGPQSYFGSNIASTPAMVIQHLSPTAYSTIDFWSSANTYLGAIGGANPNATSVPVGNAMTIYSGTASNNGIALYAVTGNISISPNSNSNIFVVTGTGANITGTANITGNANVGNIGATGGYFTTVAGTLTTAAQPNITSTGTLASLSVTGNITSGNANLGNLATANFFTGTLTTATQPNITSTGTLTSLSVSGTSNLGNVGNVKITGGSNTQVLSTDGTGNLLWIPSGQGFGNLVAPMPTYVATSNSYLVAENFQGLFTYPITIDGEFVIEGVLAQVDAIYDASNTQVIFTDGSNYVGNANFTFNKTSSTVATVNLSLTGNANLGNVSNVRITGGSSGQYLQTDGTGNLSWAAGGGGGGITAQDLLSPFLLMGA